MTLMIPLLLILGLILVVVAKSAVVIKAGEEGIHERLGKYVGTMKPGLNWKAPFIDRIISVGVLPEEHFFPDISVSDKDGRCGKIDLRVVTQVVDPAKFRYSIPDMTMLIDSIAERIRDFVRTSSLDGLGIELARFESELHNELSHQCNSWGLKFEKLKVENFRR